MASASSGLAQTTPRHVLVLTSFEQQFSPHNMFNAAFRTELTQRSPYAVQFVDVSLPSFTSDQATEAQPTLAYLHATFAGGPPNLIVSIGGVAALFAQKYRDQLFPETPLLFASVDQRFVDNSSLRNNDVAVPVSIDERSLIENIVQLLPATTTVAVVVGASRLEETWRSDLVRASQALRTPLRFVWFNDLSFDEMLKRSAALPPRSAILFAHLAIDAHGVQHVEDRALPALRAVANAPIFGVYNSQLGHGIVGGPLLDLDELGRSSAIVAVRMMQGESPQKLATVSQSLSAPTFDAAELKRWHIDNRRLPAGSVVLFREPSVWQRYRAPIVATASVGVAQTLLIVGLLILRTKRRRLERLLQESESRFRLLADTAPVMIWVSGNDKKYTDFNRAWLDFTGRTLDEEVGDGWAQGVHKDDLDNCLRTYENAFERREPFTMEYRLRRFDDEYRWIQDSGVPRFARDGTFLGYTGSAVDITDQRRAQDALSNVSRKLIQAHEAERAWVARELHDDISQRVAILIAQFDALTAQRPSADRAATVAFTALSERWRILLADIGALSHRLHSSRLDLLGLRAAAADLCKEVSGQYNVTISFRDDHVPKELPDEISLTFFRVLQEALTNAMKHSGTRAVDVVLRGTDDTLDLSVVDYGSGFDPDAMANIGLGLVSMRERLNLVNGDLIVHSVRAGGTTINACVRIAAQTDPVYRSSRTSMPA